jgi:hypothetical protein
MTQTIRAIYENGILKPLDPIQLAEHAQVMVTVESSSAIPSKDVVPPSDPLADIRFSSGLGDLSEHFDDYRFGNQP